jgi:hypothetical protein
MNYSERLAYSTAKEEFRDKKELPELIKGINDKADIMEKNGAKYGYVDVGQIYIWTAIHLRRLAFRMLTMYGKK